MSTHQTFFEKYATPLSIIVAGALVGVGIWLGKTGPNQKPNPQNQNTESAIDLKKVVKGVNQKSLESCIANQETKAKVERDIKLAAEANMQGTPHMVVLVKQGDKTVQAVLPGAQPKETIEQVIATIADYADTTVPAQVITPEDYVQGDPATAPATIVEYSDIDCPFCKRLHPTLQALVDEGKIAWVYRHSPIPQLHPDAYTKAITAECVGKLGGVDAFWKYLGATIQ